ncbi:hypothetical protein HRG_004402 [Hirsutella rhossiliensis]|uniref:Uncharacterized protein n=1 Tax=Hirsutella rhossiliensis TaxID=111463 RepID=A0A9P8N113_9HYPO|nr:uncharacterized protein HRG_04402 [Hirsutella rhossiliensis]KAH0963974.1 hypothetical protein HRG_04402 [Hirsutella rhossiliensis]
MVNGIRVLKPTLILNAKCASLLGRASEIKKSSDAIDIGFLLNWCADERIYPTASEVPNATKQFADYFIATYGDADSWAKAGYDVKAESQLEDMQPLAEVSC